MRNCIGRNDWGTGSRTETSHMCVLRRSRNAWETVRGRADCGAGRLWRQWRKLMSLIKMNQSKIFRGNSQGRATNKLAARSVNTAPKDQTLAQILRTSNTPWTLGRIPLSFHPAFRYSRMRSTLRRTRGISGGSETRSAADLIKFCGSSGESVPFLTSFVSLFGKTLIVFT